jgi:ABC-type multidrug transport system fused ATPase/permease subunit
VSFRIGAGETVGLVGPSGGGKSTVSSLISRLYDPNGGAVRIDGQDIRDVTLDSLRRQIAVVLQDVYLFRASIRDNVAFGLVGASTQEVDDALRAANAHFVWDLPDGPETIVGEGGLRLSGGQRQRVAIARALLRRPRILVLDEATSAQDTLSENAVMEALRARRGDPTIIVIAHRLSTITYADRILVLDHGQVVEQGRHAQLLAAGGLYAELYGAQASGSGPAG